jgi:N-acetylmuramoyl-L-alanine amidase
LKFLLDAGHGGVCFGHYFTPGKRSPEVPPGIYEGEFNREIAELVRHEGRHDFDIEVLNPGPINIPLKDRVDYVNQVARTEDVTLLSLHVNAAPAKGWSDANGITIFRSGNASLNSVRFAWSLSKTLESELPEMKMRGIKKRNFTIIRRTICPAVLLEMGFMTSKHDMAMLNNVNGRARLAAGILDGMRSYLEAL